MEENERLVVIDGHSLLFRAFYAYPSLTTASGELVNAVYGFSNILLSVIRELEPTHIAVSFDRAAPTFRHKEFDGYKAHRPETPEDLKMQQDRVEEIVSVLNIPIFALEGFEADDVIGTLVKKVKKKREKVEVVIVTGDLDALQLVDNKRVFVYTPGRGKKPAKLWDEDAVVNKYGLKPKQIIDLKAMAGDASDAIPGVKGIGPKTGTALLQRFSDLKQIYKNLDKVEEDFGSSVRRKLVEGEEAADMSKKLAQIVTDVPIRLSLDACVLHDYDKEKAANLFSELEFSSLIKKLPDDSFEKMVQEEIF